MKSRSNKQTLFALPLLLLTFAGCNNVKYSAREEALYVKPTIAVMDFQNRAPVHMKWQLGSALADQLTDRLMTTNRYVVLERQQLQAVLRELNRAGDPAFRKIGRPQQGRLKHVQYLVKGTITDFGHVETIEGIWRALDWGWFGSSTHSMVRATIYVIDVQSGQVIASETVEAKIADKKDQEKVNLDGAAFGSYTFYQSSLGQATDKMLDKAVISIARMIAEQPFQPKIASIVNSQIVVTGGRDRMIQLGNEYEVRPASEAIFDPDTGDRLGHITGASLGRVRITQVTEKYSIAEIVGQYPDQPFEPGQTLFLMRQETPGEKPPTKVSQY